MALHDQTFSALDARLRVAPALFAATLFCSALLLFAVQPMFAKMVLPSLGGAPSVWSVAMVFFQGALLIGYGYAHFVARRLTVGQGRMDQRSAASSTSRLSASITDARRISERPISP